LNKEDLEKLKRRLKFLNEYNTEVSDVHYTNNLRKMTNKNNHHFTHKVLTEMKDGIFNDDYLFEVMPAVKDILQLNEAYQSFSTFMEALNTDEQSLQSPSNAIRQAYDGFVSGEPQLWRLINIDPILCAV
jgi:hypothetical protein